MCLPIIDMRRGPCIRTALRAILLGSNFLALGWVAPRVTLLKNTGNESMSPSAMSSSFFWSARVMRPCRLVLIFNYSEVKLVSLRHSGGEPKGDGSPDGLL